MWGGFRFQQENRLFELHTGIVSTVFMIDPENPHIPHDMFLRDSEPLVDLGPFVSPAASYACFSPRWLNTPMRLPIGMFLMPFSDPTAPFLPVWMTVGTKVVQLRAETDAINEKSVLEFRRMCETASAICLLSLKEFCLFAYETVMECEIKGFELVSCRKKKTISARYEQILDFYCTESKLECTSKTETTSFRRRFCVGPPEDDREPTFWQIEELGNSPQDQALYVLALPFINYKKERYVWRIVEAELHLWIFSLPERDYGEKDYRHMDYGRNDKSKVREQQHWVCTFALSKNDTLEFTPFSISNEPLHAFFPFVSLFDADQFFVYK